MAIRIFIVLAAILVLSTTIAEAKVVRIELWQAIDAVSKNPANLNRQDVEALTKNRLAPDPLGHVEPPLSYLTPQGARDRGAISFVELRCSPQQKPKMLILRVHKDLSISTADVMNQYGKPSMIQGRGYQYKRNWGRLWFWFENNMSRLDTVRLGITD